MGMPRELKITWEVFEIVVCVPAGVVMLPYPKLRPCAATCTTFTNDGGPIYLAQGLSFGYGSITSPAGTQTTISNTSPVIFNSRGIPITAAGVATATDAIYLTDQYGDTYAITVYASGKVTTWMYSGGAWHAL